jgi:hypothetical protein
MRGDLTTPYTDNEIFNVTVASDFLFRPRCFSMQMKISELYLK